MMRMKGKWCSSCIAGGVALFLWGACAIAQTAPTGVAPEYKDLFNVVLGLVIALVGAYAKGVENRVKQLESRESGLRETLYREHYTKREISEQFDQVNAGILALHRRLDYLHVPKARHIPHQDDGN